MNSSILISLANLVSKNKKSLSSEKLANLVFAAFQRNPVVYWTKFIRAVKKGLVQKITGKKYRVLGKNFGLPGLTIIMDADFPSKGKFNNKKNILFLKTLPYKDEDFFEDLTTNYAYRKTFVEKLADYVDHYGEAADVDEDEENVSVENHLDIVEDEAIKYIDSLSEDDLEDKKINDILDDVIDEIGVNNYNLLLPKQKKNIKLKIRKLLKG